MSSSQSNLPAELGEVIGNYRLDSVLGRGGMGTVYLATNVRLGRRVAMKVLAPALTTDREAVSRFLSEAKVANQIHHEHIVDVFDFIETENPTRVAIVMEVLRGQPLDRLLRNGALSLSDALAIGQQIASALVAVHNAGAIHRDLKPSNVHVLERIVGEPPRIKLLDFGIAKLDDSLSDSGHRTATGMVLGTPMYMAPEQASGDPVTAAADVYGLGEILFEMVSGRPLYRGKVIEVLHTKITTAGPAIDLSGTNSALEAMVRRCLSRDPANRPSMAAVEAELRALAADAGDGVTLATAAESGFDTGGARSAPIAPPKGRRSVWLIFGVFFVAILGAGTAKLVLDPDPVPAPGTPVPTDVAPPGAVAVGTAAQTPAPEPVETPPPDPVESPPPDPVEAPPRPAVAPPRPEPRRAIAPSAPPQRPLQAILRIKVRTKSGKPAPAEVRVDDAQIASPEEVRVAPGAHWVEARPVAVDPVRARVDVRGGEEKEVVLEVCDESDTANVFVKSIPSDLLIRVAGEGIARTPKLVRIPACRSVRVEVERTGGRTEGRNFRLEPGEKDIYEVR